jgi:hypothetical protein
MILFNNSLNFSYAVIVTCKCINFGLFQCISHNFNSQDPTYYTLLAFVQREDATLNKIVNALKTMGRLDVISRTINLMSGIVTLNIIIAT